MILKFWLELPNEYWKWKCKLCGAQRRTIIECDEHEENTCQPDVLTLIRKRKELDDETKDGTN